jgi:hypothetical protein
MFYGLFNVDFYLLLLTIPLFSFVSMDFINISVVVHFDNRIYFNNN